MKFPWTLLATLVACLLTYSGKTNSIPVTVSSGNYLLNLPTYSESTVKERLAQIELPIKVRYTSQVGMYIRRYLTDGFHEAESMLGRTTLYFPIFEHYLRLYGLPESLKYVPLVESTLIPKAVSHAGAAGLWQFVPATARHYGLTVNSSVDERLDPYKSTEAAVKMLAALYAQFKDWGLVLAAYNCGPTRVRAAMRNVRGRNYWDVQSYLPRETQRYVPGFIAAAYLVNYYHHHGLTPDYPDFDLQENRAFRVYNYLRLSDVAKYCDVTYSAVRVLNPSYLRGIIPTSTGGHYLILPSAAVGKFREHYQRTELMAPAPEGRMRTTYVVVPGDRIETLALLFQCSVEDIQRWNNLKKAEVVVNQHLTVFLPRTTVRP